MKNWPHRIAAFLCSRYLVTITAAVLFTFLLIVATSWFLLCPRLWKEGYRNAVCTDFKATYWALVEDLTWNFS